MTAPRKVLIIDDVHPHLFHELEQMGYQYDYFPGLEREKLRIILHEYIGIIVRTNTSIDKEIIEKGTALRFIARAGSGMDNIDELFALNRGIQCLNAGEANADAVGEHALGMMLSLLSNIVKGDHEVRSGIWNREANRGHELSNMTIGIIGFGHTGSSFAKKLAGFSCRVLAYDKYKHDFGTDKVTESSIDRIFEEADAISLHIPLTEETRYFVNSDFIAAFKKQFYLLNLSRGKVVKTADLIAALESGKVLGCALDVLENENISKLNPEDEKFFQYLCRSDKTILTPHIAGWSFESYEKISIFLARKIKQLGVLS